MDFIKKHYEKILLAVVLLGLVGALVFLPFLITQDQQKQRSISTGVLNPKVQPLPVLDLSWESNVTKRLHSPYKLDFSTVNKLFNPLQWILDARGVMTPVAYGLVGPSAAVPTRITPLYLTVSLDSIETNLLTTNAASARYQIGVERQAAPQTWLRGKRPHYGSLGEKVDQFRIVEVTGSLDNPSQIQLVLQVLDTGDRITISKEKPYREVDGYAADLKYEPERQKWQNQRVGSALRFYNDEYNIVAINQDTVILSARSNQKKTTLHYSPENSE